MDIDDICFLYDIVSSKDNDIVKAYRMIKYLEENNLSITNTLNGVLDDEDIREYNYIVSKYNLYRKKCYFDIYYLSIRDIDSIMNKFISIYNIINSSVSDYNKVYSILDIIKGISEYRKLFYSFIYLEIVMIDLINI